MTGQYAPRNGILHVMGGLLPRPLAPHYNHVAPFYSCRIPVDANTIARTLSQAGYITGHIKKMHVGGRGGGYPFPLTYGFDFSWGNHHDYNDPELWDKKMTHITVVSSQVRPPPSSASATPMPAITKPRSYP